MVVEADVVDLPPEAAGPECVGADLELSTSRFVGNTNLTEWSCAATALPPQVVTCAYIGAPLPAGGTTSFDLIVDVDRVQDWPNNGDLIINCADVTGDQVDPDPTNNQSCDPTIQVI